MKPIHFFWILSFVVGCTTPALFGQSNSGPSSSSDYLKGLEKLFGKHKTFSATSRITLRDSAGQQKMSMEASYAIADGMVRVEMDYARIKAVELTPEAIEQLKKVGMDRFISLVRPDKKLTYMIYPALKAYVESPLPAADLTAAAATVKIEKTELGKETVDGHPCVKSRFSFEASKGVKKDGTVWEATDMDQFPIQTEFSEAGETVTTLFQNIQTSKPAASLFEPPVAGYQKYGSMQEMMAGAFSKMAPPAE